MKKIMKKTIIITMLAATAVTREIIAEEDVEDAEEAKKVVAEEAIAISIIWKN
jgi:hypothetical protein